MQAALKLLHLRPGVWRGEVLSSRICVSFPSDPFFNDSFASFASGASFLFISSPISPVAFPISSIFSYFLLFSSISIFSISFPSHNFSPRKWCSTTSLGPRRWRSRLSGAVRLGALRSVCMCGYNWWCYDANDTSETSGYNICLHCLHLWFSMIETLGVRIPVQCSPCSLQIARLCSTCQLHAKEPRKPPVKASSRAQSVCPARTASCIQSCNREKPWTFTCQSKVSRVMPINISHIYRHISY